jgi:hypothetical protein
MVGTQPTNRRKMNGSSTQDAEGEEVGESNDTGSNHNK